MWRSPLLVAALLFAPISGQSEEAINLRGQWQVGSPNYAGMMLIDAEHRVTWDATYGRSWRGYVARADAAEAEIVITNHDRVVHEHCTVQSSDLLHCRETGGKTNSTFSMTRVAPGPRNLMREIQ